MSNKNYVYIWADGVHSNVRMDYRLCLLVIIGSDESERNRGACGDGWIQRVYGQLGTQDRQCFGEVSQSYIT